MAFYTSASAHGKASIEEPQFIQIDSLFYLIRANEIDSVKWLMENLIVDFPNNQTLNDSLLKLNYEYKIGLSRISILMKDAELLSQCLEGLNFNGSEFNHLITHFHDYHHLQLVNVLFRYNLYINKVILDHPKLTTQLPDSLITRRYCG